MSKRSIGLLMAGLALSLGVMARADESFAIKPIFYGYVNNDDNKGGPDAPVTISSGLEARNISTRRRVGYLLYDISELKAIGPQFYDVSVSVYGHDSGVINVYGILEEYESLVNENMTYNTAPGLVPATAIDTDIELNPDQLTELLLSFNAPARGTRAASEISEALGEFLSADTTGIVALMFAPEGNGSAIVRTLGMGEDGGTILQGMVGGTAAAAAAPVPANGATDVYNATDLSWKPGGYAATHRLYLSTDFDDVNTAQPAALVADGLTEPAFTPSEPLAFGTTYYWRVDEVNSVPDTTVYPGPVWSFTVEPQFYEIADINATASSSGMASRGPANVVNGSGLDVDADTHDSNYDNMWLSGADDPAPWIQFAFDRVYNLATMKVWNYNGAFENVLGIGIQDVNVETSLDGQTWVPFPAITQLAQGTGMDGYAVNNVFDMNGVAARYVRLQAVSNYNNGQMGTQVGLAEVQFLYEPTYARVPEPVDGATDVDLSLELSWRAGRGATEHRVYLGTDPNQVTARDASTLVGTVAGDSLLVNGLEYDSTYTWVVDAVGLYGTVSGEPWTFSTPAYLELDGFESYDDDCNRIYWAWRDGAGFSADDNCGIAAYNGNGSSTSCYVGYASSPFAEKKIVHGGLQSMPFEYANTQSPFYSEAVSRPGLLPSDWTVGGVDTLTLFFQGYPADVTQVAADHLIISGSGADIFGTADEFRYVYQQLAGDGTLVARVVRLDNTDPWAKAGLMIRASLESEAQNIMIYVSAENGVRLQQRTAFGGSSTSDSSAASDEQMAVGVPTWLKIERIGDTINGYYATDEAGTNWMPAAGNPQTIPMTTSVTIGLAVTSHAAGSFTVAEFTDIAATGSISGGWTAEAIGVEQPSNSAERIYVKVTDSANHSKTVFHDDTAATQIGSWEQWDIPLSAFSGVNLAAVKDVTFGVGTGASAGGDGVVFVDDLRLTKSSD